MSSRPKRSIAVRIALSASARLRTSPGLIAASAPSPFSVSRTPSNFDLSRPVITSAAPAFANAVAMPKPTPWPPPVTRATFPANLPIPLSNIWRSGAEEFAQGAMEVGHRLFLNWICPRHSKPARAHAALHLDHVFKVLHQYEAPIIVGAPILEHLALQWRSVARRITHQRKYVENALFRISAVWPRAIGQHAFRRRQENHIRKYMPVHPGARNVLRRQAREACAFGLGGLAGDFAELDQHIDV